MNEGKLISTTQLVTLMLVSRLFTASIYMSSGDIIYGTDAMIAIVAAALIQIILMIPVYFLLKGQGDRDMIACAYMIHPVVGKVSAVLLWLFCLSIAGGTVLSFQYFLSYSAYPIAGAWVIILIFAVAIIYASYMGLEAVARLSFYVFFAFLVMLGFIGVALIPRYSMARVMMPFVEGTTQYPYLILQLLTRNSELILIPMMMPLLKGKVRKSFFGYLLISTVLLEALTGIVVAALGEYAKTQKFPVYTAATIAEMSVLERLDSIYLTVWIFLAFVKAALFLYMANRCFSYFVRWKTADWSMPIAMVIIVGAAVYLSGDVGLFGQFYRFIASGIPMATVLLALPCLLLLLRLAQKKRKGADANG